MTNPIKTNAGACEINQAKQAAEIAAAIEWCSYSYGHKTARLLVRLRDQLAEKDARGDADDLAERLSLIEDTCRDLIARIDRKEYNYGLEHVRADLSYLLACADVTAQ